MCVPCLLLRANCCFSLREATAAPSIIAQRQCSRGAGGRRATFEAAYVSCRIYDHPRRQSMSVTSAKCRDVRGRAVYDRAAQCGPSIGFHLASQMFPTTDSKWALERENGLFERDIDQCFIYSCFQMLYEHDYFFKIILSVVSRNKRFKPVWTPGFLSLCILTIQYSTVVQDRQTERQSWLKR